ncbi:hypothetical protein JCM11251_007405 [Rhodosporidiobolus azoricus]
MLTKTTLSALVLLGASLADAAPVTKVDVEPRAAGEVVSLPLLSFDGLSYGVQIDIGNPAQTLPLLVDTGSSDLVASDNCTPGLLFHSHTFLTLLIVVYDASVTQDYNRRVTYNYVSGSYRGRLVNDVLSIGGLTAGKLWFGHADLPAELNGGIFGMNFQQRAKVGKPTFLQALISAGQLAEPKFALRLGAPDANYVAGEITLGGAQSTGDVTTVPVPEGINDWVLKIADYAAGDAKVYSAATTASVDSASPVTYLPRKAAAAIYAGIPGARLDVTYDQNIGGQTFQVDSYAVPCDATVKPGFSFAGAEGKTLYIAPENFLMTQPDGNCGGSIYGADHPYYDGSSGAILGVDFLKSQYSVFNFKDSAHGDKPTISFSATA